MSVNSSSCHPRGKTDCEAPIAAHSSVTMVMNYKKLKEETCPIYVISSFTVSDVKQHLRSEVLSRREVDQRWRVLGWKLEAPLWAVCPTPSAAEGHVRW